MGKERGKREGEGEGKGSWVRENLTKGWEIKKEI